MIAAIVVTYNPDLLVLDVLQSLISQADIVVVVDNCSTSKDNVQIAKAKFPDLVLLAMEKNLGLGAAYNIGIEHSKNLGASNIMLSDQDSIFEPGFVTAMQNALFKFPDSILGPLIVDRQHLSSKRYEVFTNWTFHRVPVTQENQPVTLLIGSGMTFSIATYEALGPFNEWLFVDYVDTEYCLRARKQGKKCLVISGAHLLHQMGNCTSHKLLGKTFHPKNYSPFRKFLIYRNRIHLWKRYFSFGMIAWDLAAMGFDIVQVLLFEGQKLTKIASTLNGIYTGIKSKAKST